MAENNPDDKMFVLLTLCDGIETLPTILELLNDRYIGWRNTRTSNFTLPEILPSVQKATKLGFVDLWYDDGSSELRPMGGSIEAMLATARTDPEAVWFHLTTEGRQAVEAWELPKGLDKQLFEEIASTPSGAISLYAAYRLLAQHAASRLDYAEFGNLINALIQFDRVRLWHSSSTKPDIANMTPVAVVPSEIYDVHLLIEPANKETDPLGYFLTLGKKTFADTVASEPLEPIAQTPDPVMFLAKLKERNPRPLTDFASRKGLLHIVFDEERNALSVGIGPIREFVEKMRWSRGLTGMENVIVRHVVLDEAGNVAGDYYGPASLDMLDMK